MDKGTCTHSEGCTAERAAFEAWAAKRWGREAHRHTSTTCGEWDAWQARAALSRALAAPTSEPAEDLQFLRTKLKTGEYDGADIMRAWIAIDELQQLRNWREKAFEAYPNLDLDIERLNR